MMQKVRLNRRPDVAVVGGGYAGLMAAARLAVGGRSVVIVDPKPVFVHRLKLHRRLAGKALATLPWSTVLPRGVERLAGRAIGWQEGTLVVQTPEEERSLRPRRLLLATGSRTRQIWDDPLVVDLDDLDAAKALAGRPRVVVAGGGATGIETASALAWSGRQVTLVADGFPGLAQAATTLLVQGLHRRGVQLVEDRLADVGDGAAHRENGAPIPCDAVVPCLGFVPAPTAARWGLPTDERGRVIASSSLQITSDTYAAGDAVAVRGMPWVGSGAATAMPLGAHAAASLLADLAGEAPPSFRFGWTVKNLDLCGGRGVLQRLEPDGTPTAEAASGLGPVATKAL
ncbi:MAG: FAD-dependent oxidoreductase, partial [Myxococcota bacterium]